MFGHDVWQMKDAHLSCDADRPVVRADSFVVVVPASSEALQIAEHFLHLLCLVV